MGSATGSRAKSGRTWTEQDMDRVISLILRAGLVLCAVLVIFGGALYLARHGGETVAYRLFRGEPPSYRYLPGILDEALHIHGRGFILAGLIVLVATPVVRVAYSVLAFALRREPIYIAATLIVLGILLFSLITGGLR